MGVFEFWQMTPKELQMCFQADAWRQRRERRRDAWVAWHVAGLMRVKRMPALKTLMPVEPLSADELKQKRQDHTDIVERLGHGRRR